MSITPKTHRLIRDIHLWSGLIVGIFIFLICLSGTILTFQKDIETILHPNLHSPIMPARGERFPMDVLIKKMEERTGGRVQRISISGEETAPHIFNIKTSPKDRRGKPFYVNPFTGEVLNNPEERSAFFFFFFRLHRWLLLDPKLGSPIVGSATLVFILLLASGFYLWWPRTNAKLISSLKVNFRGSWKKANYDLHNTLGFYSLPFLLIMALTGLCWSFEWYRNGLSQILKTPVFGERREAPLPVSPQQEKLSLEKLILTSNQVLTYKGSLTLQLPASKEAAFVVSKSPTSNFSVNFTDKLQIDPYKGTILKIERFVDKPLGKKISSLIRHLHTGDFLGIFSRIIYFITCLIATTLPITGTLIWFNKQKRKRNT